MLITKTRRHLLLCCAMAFSVFAPAQSVLAATELTVYTAVEAEDLARYAEAFNQDHPDHQTGKRAGAAAHSRSIG